MIDQDRISASRFRTDARCRITLLGEVRVETAEGSITRFRSRKFAALLAFLAFHHQRPHPREALIEMLWPECDPDAGRNRLSTALWSLRRQLEPPGEPAGSVLVADRLSVGLNGSQLTTDVAEFEATLRTASEAGSPAAKVRCLRAAVELYRGPLLAGYYEDWIAPERHRLAELHLQVLRELSSCLRAAGDLDGALDYARRAAAAEPLSEEAHCDLIRLYAATGAPSAALRQYRLLQHALKEGLSVTPSEAARSLIREVTACPPSAAVESARRAVAPSPAEAPPPTASPTPREPPQQASPGHLPLRLTRFFGRGREIEELVGLLGGSPAQADRIRLVTLTGPGGSGKTRLALEAAERLTARFEGRAWFVPFADVAEPSRVPDACLSALRLPRVPAREPLDRLSEALAGPLSLLIVDNCEHLVDAAADLVRALLERLPGLACLVTSRRALGLSFERELPVPPLALPPRLAALPDLATVDSVRLFVDRAQAVRPDFQLTRGNAAVLTELCARLEGIPLAIELAAARAQVLAPAQMLAQLDSRFELLVSRKRDAVPRHRSLRTAVDWSYRLLDPELMRLFRNLSVFRGGWSLEAAEAVCGEGPGTSVLSGLEELRAASLIHADESGGQMRFRTLETLREFALEQLDDREAAELGVRHTRYYVALAETAEPELRGSEQAAWLDRVDLEHDNLRAALERSRASDDHAASANETGLRLGGALWRFWLTRGYWAEGSEQLTRALAAAPPRPTAARGRALQGASAIARDRGDYRQAHAYAEESVTIWRALGEKQGLAWALGTLGLAEHALGRLAEARDCYQESLVLCRELGDLWGTAWALNDLGNGAYYHGDLRAARPLYEQSLAIRRKVGDLRGVAWSLQGLGNVACCLGDDDAARPCLEESLAIQRELGDRIGMAWSLLALGLVMHRRWDYAAARRHYEESLEIWREIGDREVARNLLHNLADVARSSGDHSAAIAYERDATESNQQGVPSDRTSDTHFWRAFLGVNSPLPAGSAVGSL